MRKAAAIASTAGLAEAGLIAPEAAPALAAVEEAFSVRLTPEVLAQIGQASLSDPVYAQYVPQEAELLTRADEREDPIGDEAHEKVKGLIHRYPDRVLLKPVQTCAVYCRFCFRREKVGQGSAGLTAEELDAALGYIAATPAVREVILTGGDPLVLSTRRLASLIERIAAISHVELLRLHSRVPLVEPARITPELVKALRRHKAPHLVIHVNHAQELSAPVAKAIALMVDGGIPVLSQSVLLKGINDEAATLEDLFRALTRLRVSPYYLHHLDKARGTGHFRVSLKEGRALMAALRGRLPGHALPRYVIDIPGGFGKVPVDGDHVFEITPGEYDIADPWGQRHRYRDI